MVIKEAKPGQDENYFENERNILKFLKKSIPNDQEISCFFPDIIDDYSDKGILTMSPYGTPLTGYVATKSNGFMVSDCIEIIIMLLDILDFIHNLGLVEFLLYFEINM